MKHTEVAKIEPVICLTKKALIQKPKMPHNHGIFVAGLESPLQPQIAGSMLLISYPESNNGL